MSEVNKTMLISVVVNLGLSIIKIIGGLIGCSNSLIADGIHSFSDLTTDVIAIIGVKLSLKPADPKHPFGHGKIEYLTSIVISLIILGLGITVIYRTFESKLIFPQMWVTVISILTIVAKLFLSKFIIIKGKKLNNNVLIASGKESLSDVYGSVMVFISIILMYSSRYIDVLKYADILTSIIIGLLILKIGYQILKENVVVLLDEQIEDKNYLEEIQNTILEEQNILKIKHLHILKNGPYYKLLSTVIMDKHLPIGKAHDIIDEVEEKIKKKDKKIKYVIIHIEPND